MCRYALSLYKPHYACFECRKTFKRRLIIDIEEGYNKNREEIEAKCPECGSLMANMGKDFEAPKKKDIKAWKHLQLLYKVGITFHSCGCTGPGYIPNNIDDLLQYFLKIKEDYLKHQEFWARRRNDPTTQSEIDRDKSQNSKFFYSTPMEARVGTKNKPQYDANKAQIYWGQKIKAIEEKIQMILDGKS